MCGGVGERGREGGVVGLMHVAIQRDLQFYFVTTSRLYYL